MILWFASQQPKSISFFFSWFDFCVRVFLIYFVTLTQLVWCMCVCAVDDHLSQFFLRKIRGFVFVVLLWIVTIIRWDLAVKQCKDNWTSKAPRSSSSSNSIGHHFFLADSEYLVDIRNFIRIINEYIAAWAILVDVN